MKISNKVLATDARSTLKLPLNYHVKYLAPFSHSVSRRQPGFFLRRPE